MLFLTTILSLALAESPNPLPKGSKGLYQGLGYGWFNSYDGASGTSKLPGTVSVMESNTIMGTGISKTADLWVQLPIRYIQMGEGRPNGDVFDPTFGLGAVSLGSKIQLAKQNKKMPLAVSVSPTLRVGTHNAETRGRLTNLGEGTIDLGAALLLGNSGKLNSGTYWIEGAGRYWFRMPQSFDRADPPADDIEYSFETGMKVHPKIGLALASFGMWRLGGEDYTSLTGDPDLWASLDTSQIKVGGKFNYHVNKRIAVYTGFFRSVYAENNPTDENFVSIGVGYYKPKKKRK